jgi:hypothetical protein
MDEVKKLNRFTTLPVLLDLLQRKKLVLLDPELWEDRNDSEVIKHYKEKKSINKLFALCFSYGDETIHHWKAYSNGSCGCCIEFNAKELFKILEKINNVKHAKVEYKKLQDAEANGVPLDEMPFKKRWPYRCEEEYRIILETDTGNNFYEIDINLDIIQRITISQQMPEQIYQTIKNYLKKAKGDPDSKISRSTLYENKRWINSFKRNG